LGSPSPPSGAHRRGCGGAQAVKKLNKLRNPRSSPLPSPPHAHRTCAPSPKSAPPPPYTPHAAQCTSSGGFLGVLFRCCTWNGGGGGDLGWWSLMGGLSRGLWVRAAGCGCYSYATWRLVTHSFVSLPAAVGSDTGVVNPRIADTNGRQAHSPRCHHPLSGVAISRQPSTADRGLANI